MAIPLDNYIRAYAATMRSVELDTPYLSTMKRTSAPERRAGKKCASCSSLEYVSHRGTSICTYCRTPEETVATPMAGQRRDVERTHSSLGALWGG